jgi:hypothetical protein
MNGTRGPALLAVGALLFGSGGVVCPSWADEAAVRSGKPPALPARYARLLKLVQPGPGESPFERVPWVTFLWEARLRAAAVGKPIFVWAAGGPPGGC